MAEERTKGFFRTWVFGGLLPWVGWETVPTDEDGEPATSGPREADFLTIEWLGIGTTVMRGAVRRPAKSEAKK